MMPRTRQLKKRSHHIQLLEHLDPSQPYDPDNIPFSLLIQMINVLVESGESLFIGIFKQLLDEVDDPELQDAMKVFIYQEANHSRLYQVYTDKLKQSSSPCIDQLLQASDEHFKTVKAHLSEDKSLQERLHFVIMCELFAFNFFKYFIEHYSDRIDELDPVATYLYMLHGIEEIEHNAIAFDVYTQLYGAPPNQDPANLEAFNRYSKHMIKSLLGWTVLAAEEWNQDHPEQAVDRMAIADMLMGENGVFPDGKLCPNYAQADFHPSQNNIYHVIEQWDTQWCDQLMARIK